MDGPLTEYLPWRSGPLPPPSTDGDRIDTCDHTLYCNVRLIIRCGFNMDKEHPESRMELVIWKTWTGFCPESRMESVIWKTWTGFCPEYGMESAGNLENPDRILPGVRNGVGQ
ncbi:hypothetical protein TURU_065021 [Turdus rufiventris]|nr:hypothetical protein TURU_065021 [Turdus rufiventris]